MKPDYAAVEAAFEKLCDGCPLPLRVDIWIERHAGDEIRYTAMIQDAQLTECSTSREYPADAADAALSKYKNATAWKVKRISALQSELAKLKGEK